MPGNCLCYCSICCGKYVQKRTRQRHLQADLKRNESQCDHQATKLQNLLIDPKLQKTIVGKWTVLKLMMEMLDIKSDNPQVPNDVISRILVLMSSILQEAGVDVSCLPSSFDQLLSLAKSLIPDSVDVPLCPGCGHTLQTAEIDQDQCVKCASTVYVKGKRLKVVHVLPLIPRLRQMFGVQGISQMLKNKDNLKPASDFRKIQSCTADSDGSVVLRLIYSTDGGCPWNFSNCSYSVRPGTIEIMNLPNSVCRDPTFTMLVFLTEGPQKPKDINAVQEYLIMELQQLEHGIQMYDAHTKTIINVKAILQIITADWPARCAITHIPFATAAENACPDCTIKGVHDALLHKQLFVTKQLELKKPVNYDMVRRLQSQPTTENLEKFLTDSGKNGVELFATLLNYNDAVVVKDPMHLFRNIIVKLHDVTCGKMKSNVIEAEQSMQRFMDGPTYSLTTAKLKQANNRYHEIVFPKSWIDSPTDLFVKTNQSMKSHTWIRLLCAGVYNYCLYDIAEKMQFLAIRELCTLIRQFLDYDLSPATNFSELQKFAETVVHQLQDAYPRTICTLQLHLLCHFVAQLENFGPCKTYWMFNSERYMKWILDRMQLNKARAEATAINNYKLRFQVTLLKCVTDDFFCKPKIDSPFVSKPKLIDLTDNICGSLVAKWNQHFPNLKSINDFRSCVSCFQILNCGYSIYRCNDVVVTKDANILGGFLKHLVKINFNSHQQLYAVLEMNNLFKNTDSGLFYFSRNLLKTVVLPICNNLSLSESLVHVSKFDVVWILSDF